MRKLTHAIEAIASKILLVRGHKVMIDADLATLYGVTTKRFNEQIKRNHQRFPEDFMFQLTPAEWQALRSQFATSNTSRGGRRYLPHVFTEHGAIMAATVLNSEQAVDSSIYVVRACASYSPRTRTWRKSWKNLSASCNRMIRPSPD
jgi:hypothetical protein